MATSTITQTRPARPQRRRPDDLRILQVYEYEKRERGTRGAYRRAGDMLGVSDETVRRIVHAADHREQAKAEEAAAGLEYTPPPFADELAIWRAQRDVTSHATPQGTLQPAGNATTPIMSSGAEQDAQNGAHVAAAVANLPHATANERHTPELPESSPEVPQTPQDPEPEPREPEPAASPEDPGPPLPKSAAFYRSEPIVVRQIVRVPVEAHRGGVVEWLNDRPGLRNQLLAVAVFLVLVVMTWIG